MSSVVPPPRLERSDEGLHFALQNLLRELGIRISQTPRILDMNLLVIILLVLLLAGGGGGFYYGGPYVGGGLGLVLLIVLILALTGRIG